MPANIRQQAGSQESQSQLTCSQAPNPSLELSGEKEHLPLYSAGLALGAACPSQGCWLLFSINSNDDENLSIGGKAWWGSASHQSCCFCWTQLRCAVEAALTSRCSCGTREEEVDRGCFCIRHRHEFFCFAASKSKMGFVYLPNHRGISRGVLIGSAPENICVCSALHMWLV